MRLLASCLLFGQAAAATKSWQIIAANIGTISTGIDFVNATTGFIGLDINGVGAEVARSSDGGKTWPFVGQSPFGLLFLDVAAFGPNVVVAGVLELLYSNDHGATFQSANATPGAGQCIRNIGPNGAEIGFASVGDWGIFTDVNGIVVSYDGGATFATISDNMTADSRYGAFPTATTWYVTGGTWPGEGADDDPFPDDNTMEAKSAQPRTKAPADPSWYTDAVPAGSVVIRRFSRHHILKAPAGQHLVAWVKPGAAGNALRGRNLQATGWTGQISRTTDAGKTWQTVYTEAKTSEFYFNGIECASDKHCCAVAEGDLGTFVYCTSDGGATWNATYNNPDPNSSLIDIAALSPTEYWACGMEAGTFGPTAAHFVHTTDGGVTWTLEPVTIPEQFASAVDCDPVSGQCWANMLSLLQETSVAALVTNSSKKA